jgi:hypothetical protein
MVLIKYLQITTLVTIINFYFYINFILFYYILNFHLYIFCKYMYIYIRKIKLKEIKWILIVI